MMAVLKRYRYPFLIVIFLLAQHGEGTPLYAKKQILTGVIIKSRDAAYYNRAIDGLRKSSLKENLKINLQEYTLPAGQNRDLEKFFDDIRNKDERPAVIITVGTKATQLAKGVFPETPIVFLMVYDPVGMGLVRSLKSPGGNLTGACLNVPLKAQLENLSLVVPQAKRIGIVYDPDNTGDFVREARDVATLLGMELVTVPVHSVKDVPAAFESLIDEVDAVWALMDSTVYRPESSEFILLLMIRNKLPLMAFSEQYVEAGSLLGSVSDVARQGEMTVEVLKELFVAQKAPAEISVRVTDDPLLFLNARIAKAIGIDFSEEAEAKAFKLFK